MQPNDSERRGRLRLRHLMETTEAVGETMDNERERFDALRDQGPTRHVSAFNLFQTPVAIAEMMVAAAGSLDGLRVLEPSAGLGRLYRAIRDASGAHVTLVEQATACAGELYRMTEHDHNARLIHDDFLTCDADRLGGLFDVVVMNPPFKRGADIRHIHHAASMLTPGGLLVSLCYAGVKQSVEFIGKPGWTWEQLPDGSFRSEGTRAAVSLLTYQR